MQTYTHFVMTAVLNRAAKSREANLTQPAEQGSTAINRLPPVNSFWLMVGSVMPDVPLILITFGAIAMDLWSGNRLEPGNEAAEMHSYTGYLFRYAFFHEPWVKLAHNLFHAPLLILLYGLVGYWLWQQSGIQVAAQQRTKRGAALFWFALACGLHTAIDIPLHYDDGPLILFPFDWQTRVYSPVSYWDPERYGRPFAIFEHILLLGMLLFLLVDWWRRRQARRTAIATN
jgi:LexA-binding, inner membrane-associated putative hydrolase